MAEDIQRYLNQAHAAYQKRSVPEARRLYQRVLDIDPDNDTALHNLGVISDVGGELSAAEDYYGRALRANTDNNAARRNLASLLFDAGRLEESAGLYRVLIAANPGDADAHFAYSRLTHYSPTDPTLDALEIAGSRIGELPADSQVKVCFAIGKANQDLGDFATAWDAFAAGNRLHYAMHPYDESANYAMLADIARCLDADYLSGREDSGVDDEMPIFVLGMPRSGSTLVEQILASHSEVSAAGEVRYLKQCIQQHLIRDKGTFSRAIPGWTRADLERCALEYLALLRSHADGARHVVDKMPGNFAFVGLIRLLLPGAKIVHTSRHPAATLWSCFSTHFAGTLNYTYDLAVLTRYIAHYRRHMAHWRGVLPPGAFHELEYEELVRDPETTTRGLLEQSGLSWQPACLEFHRTQRRVKTASVAQVRQPLYATAVDLWQHYRERLEPFTSRITR